MDRGIRSVILVVISSLVVAVPSIWAAWVEDGVPVCTAALSQENPASVSDGKGGTIVTWRDYRSGSNYDIYAQRINAAGAFLWAGLEAVAVCTAAGNQEPPGIVSDGAGGAIITWMDSRFGTPYIYAQRLNARGKPQWASNGVLVCNHDALQVFSYICPDGSGGAIIAWMDYRPGDGTSDIYAQRVSGSGVCQWASGGVAICAAADYQINPLIVSDGMNGAIVAWQDARNGLGLGESDIYAQRVNSLGMIRWTPNGVPVCIAPYQQSALSVVSNGAGGAIIAWMDWRDGDYSTDIYAESLNDSGESEWNTNGIAVCTDESLQETPRSVVDGAGGAIIAWTDFRNGAQIYAQRVNYKGATQWKPDGVAVADAVQNYNNSIVPDGSGGAIIAYMGSHAGKRDIYAQRINPSGESLWSADGEAVCTEETDQMLGSMVSDGDGGAIVAWSDTRYGTSDIHAQQINSEGMAGYLPPVVHSILDVPGDEGGRVNLAWVAPPFDYLAGEIDKYTIWRALDTPAALAVLKSGAAVMSNQAGTNGEKGSSILRLASLNGETYFWELVASLDAYRLTGYSSIVSTLFDSTAVCSQYHYFQVIAHTSDPAIFYVSKPDSGYSVDNIAPCPPACLAGEQKYAPEGLSLIWNRNEEADLDEYRVYRGLEEDFVPGSGNLIASCCDTTCFDGGWRWNGGYYYKVSALDVHGNESGFALLKPTDITGAETPKVPGASYLSQNSPNPFNPLTRIPFGLSKRVNISLRVYDAAGRLVRTIAEGYREAGHYVESWDGKDESGRAVASGVYFCRLDAGTFRQTRKTILLR